jgi:predicted O-linked N-acetylglucosamine transferase (SPINDLY family)
MNQTFLNEQLKKASELQVKGDFKKAKKIYTSLISKAPLNFNLLHLFGSLEAQLGNFDNAKKLLKEALIINPSFTETLNNLGNLNIELKNYNEAIELYQKSIAISNQSWKIYVNLGIALHEIKKYSEAINSFEDALILNNNNADIIFLKAEALSKINHHDLAIENYKKALIIDPNNEKILLSLINSQLAIRNYYDALINSEILIANQIKNPNSLLIKANVLLHMNKAIEAKVLFKEYISLERCKDSAYLNLGNIQLEFLLLKDAILSFNNSILINNNNADAFIGLASTYMMLGLYKDAIENYSQAININPKNEAYYFYRSSSYGELQQYDKSFEDSNKAISLNPKFAEAYNNKGYYILKRGQPEAAIVYFEIAIGLDPNLVIAMINRAEACRQINEYEKALDGYLKAIEINSFAPYVMGKCLFLKKMICDWSNFEEGVIICKSMLADKIPAAVPFEVLHLIDDPQLHLESALISNQDKKFTNYPEYLFQNFSDKPKIRIGYFSADLYYHPVSIWLAEQLENHDKSQFELIAFCMNSVIDPMSVRLKTSFSQWIEIGKLPDIEAISIARELELDIAIDLNGFTADSRTGIFASRVAPIQISHLGFPGSMGAKFIDYIISDKHTVNESNRDYFTEKIAFIPCGYTYDRQRRLSDALLKRQDFGLREDSFVFTCQNGCQKFTPEVFGIWMSILKAVPNSVLWLLEPNTLALKNLKTQIELWGIETDRVVFTPRLMVSKEEEQNRIAKYLSSYKLADLFLDTWPYNAGTTAVDALWAGLPVLTKVGLSMGARMAAGPLYQLEMNELITHSPKEYQSLAIELANDSAKLNQLKEKLEKNKMSLFDPVTNTRYIESAYLEMHRRYKAKLTPEDFIVNS